MNTADAISIVLRMLIGWVFFLTVAALIWVAISHVISMRSVSRQQNTYLQTSLRRRINEAEGERRGRP